MIGIPPDDELADVAARVELASAPSDLALLAEELRVLDEWLRWGHAWLDGAALEIARLQALVRRQRRRGFRHTGKRRNR